MVDYIVQEVLNECHDREHGTIRPNASEAVLLRCECMDPRYKNLRRGFELVSDDLRILLAVPLVDRRLILVPVGEGRRVLLKHLHKTAVEEPVDVAYVGTIFQGRPDVWLRACRNCRTRAQNLHPFFSCDKRSLSEVFRLDFTDRQTALVAPPGQNPCPILGVWLRVDCVRGE